MVSTSILLSVQFFSIQMTDLKHDYKYQMDSKGISKKFHKNPSKKTDHQHKRQPNMNEEDDSKSKTKTLKRNISELANTNNWAMNNFNLPQKYEAETNNFPGSPSFQPLVPTRIKPNTSDEVNFNQNKSDNFGPEQFYLNPPLNFNQPSFSFGQKDAFFQEKNVEEPQNVSKNREFQSKNGWNNTFSSNFPKKEPTQGFELEHFAKKLQFKNQQEQDFTFGPRHKGFLIEQSPNSDKYRQKSNISIPKAFPAVPSFQQPLPSAESAQNPTRINELKAAYQVDTPEFKPKGNQQQQSFSLRYNVQPYPEQTISSFALQNRHIHQPPTYSNYNSLNYLGSNIFLSEAACSARQIRQRMMNLGSHIQKLPKIYDFCIYGAWKIRDITSARSYFISVISTLKYLSSTIQNMKEKQQKLEKAQKLFVPQVLSKTNTIKTSLTQQLSIKNSLFESTKTLSLINKQARLFAEVIHLRQQQKQCYFYQPNQITVLFSKFIKEQWSGFQDVVQSLLLSIGQNKQENADALQELLQYLCQTSANLSQLQRKLLILRQTISRNKEREVSSLFQAKIQKQTNTQWNEYMLLKQCSSILQRKSQRLRPLAKK